MGYPVVDVMVTLLDGSHHDVDSSDFAFQEAGRAGRDGRRANCIMLYSPEDRAIHESLLSRSRVRPEQLYKLGRALAAWATEDKVPSLESLALSAELRRQQNDDCADQDRSHRALVAASVILCCCVLCCGGFACRRLSSGLGRSDRRTADEQAGQDDQSKYDALHSFSPCSTSR